MAAISNSPSKNIVQTNMRLKGWRDRRGTAQNFVEILQESCYENCIMDTKLDSRVGRPQRGILHPKTDLPVTNSHGADRSPYADDARMLSPSLRPLRTSHRLSESSCRQAPRCDVRLRTETPRASHAVTGEETLLLPTEVTGRKQGRCPRAVKPAGPAGKR